MFGALILTFFGFASYMSDRHHKRVKREGRAERYEPQLRTTLLRSQHATKSLGLKPVFWGVNPCRLASPLASGSVDRSDLTAKLQKLDLWADHRPWRAGLPKVHCSPAEPNLHDSAIGSARTAEPVRVSRLASSFGLGALARSLGVCFLQHRLDCCLRSFPGLGPDVGQP